MTDKPRRPPNLTEKVAVLTRQALCGCGCGQRLQGRMIEYHHMHERALGGPDHPDNYAAVVADDNGERNCHAILTNGTKATKANSSKSKIAKANRLEAARLALAGAEKPKPPPELTERFQFIGTRAPTRRTESFGGGIRAGKTAKRLSDSGGFVVPGSAIELQRRADDFMLIPKKGRGARLDRPTKTKGSFR